MPRMVKGYLESRRGEILDAAYDILQQKPLMHITMKDIIRKCGASQGAIYHYFKSTDEIWLGLIERYYAMDDLLPDLAEVLAAEYSARETLHELGKRLFRQLELTVPVYGKLVLEINAAVHANPGLFGGLERAQEGNSQPDALQRLFADWSGRELEKGRIRPKVTLPQLEQYVVSSYLGTRYLAVMLYLQGEAGPVRLREHLDMQAQSWELAMAALLGLEDSI